MRVTRPWKWRVALAMVSSLVFSGWALRADPPPPPNMPVTRIDPQILTQLDWETRALYSHLRRSLVRVKLDPNPVHILPPDLQRKFLTWERQWVLSHHFHAANRPEHHRPTVAIVPESSRAAGHGKLTGAQRRQLASLSHNSIAQLFLMRHFLFEQHHPDQPPPWKYLQLINQRLMLLRQHDADSLPGVVIGPQHHILVLGLLGTPGTKGSVPVVDFRGRTMTGRILGVDSYRNLSVVSLPDAVHWPSITLANAGRGGDRMQLSLDPNTRALQWKIRLRGNRNRHFPGNRGSAYRTRLMLSRQGWLTGVQSGMQIFRVTRHNPIFSEFIATGVIRPQRFGIKYALVEPNAPIRKQNPLLGNRPAILVLQVFPHSPAREAGIKQGDLITAMNHISIIKLPLIMRNIRRNPRVVSVSLIRHDHPLTLTIDLTHVKPHGPGRHGGVLFHGPPH